MAYILNKPFTETQRADFICEHQGLNYYENDTCIIMYLDSEKILNDEAVDRTQDVDYKEKIKKENITNSLNSRNKIGNSVSNTLLWDDLLLEAGFLVEALDFEINGTNILVVLTNGDIYFSSDSITFIKTTNIKNALKIKYINSKWYLMTRTGIIYTSIDGTNFTQLITIKDNLDVKANRKENKVSVFTTANDNYYTNTELNKPTNIIA